MLYSVVAMKQNQQREHTTNCGYMQLIMPLDLGMRIPEDDSVRLLIKVTERMDYTVLDRAYIRASERGEATPKQLFQLVILGRMNGRYSVRELAEACRTDIRFMWLLQGKRAPSASRFARFIQKRLADEVMEQLFYQFVLLLQEDEEISFENLFVDGTKNEGYANRYTFVWKKAVTKRAEKLGKKLADLLIEIRTAYPFQTSHAQTEQDVLQAIEALANDTGVVFVQGSGKRKTALQKHIEELRGMLAKHAEYARQIGICANRNSYSKTDHDATFMRMKDDHMKNGQLKPAYNLQLGVEGEYIVGVYVTQDRDDTHALLPLLSRMNKYDCPQPKNVIADAGYESEENYVGLAERGITAYIKPQNYEQRKKRGFRQNAYLRENMPYDAQTDSYVCPAGKRLAWQYDTVRRSRSGYEQCLSVYDCDSCVGCPMKAICTKAKGNRRITVSHAFDGYRAAALSRIRDEQGALLRVNRTIQSEGVFGCLKENWRFRRYMRRGMRSVMTETLLYAFAYDLKKLHAKTVSGRLQTYLHYPSSA